MPRRRKVVISTGAGELRTTGGEKKPPPQKKRRAEPPPITAAERREIERVVGSAAQGVVRGAQQVAKQGERVVGGVLTRAEQERRARLRRETKQTLRSYEQDVRQAKRLGLPTPPRPELPIARVERELQRLLLEMDKPREPYKSGAERRREGILDFLTGGAKAGLQAEMDWVVNPTIEMAKLGSRNTWLLASDPAKYWAEQQQRDREYAARGEPQMGIFPGGGKFGKRARPGRKHDTEQYIRDNPDVVAAALKRDEESATNLGEQYLAQHPDLAGPPAGSLPSEPPLSKGKIRLYRGEPEDALSLEEQGLIPGEETHYFTTDKETAADYGAVRYVDVSKAVAKEHASGAGTYELPGTIASKAKPLRKTVADVLPAAARARKVQEEGYSVERGKRFSESRATFGKVGGGIAGHRAAKGELAGELPKVDFNRLREGDYGPAELDRDINTIYGHPDLTDGEITRAADALEGMALHGITPQKKQIKLLAEVFGPDEAAKIVARSLGDRANDALGLFRSLMTTLDLSLNMRQALPLLFRNPNIWRKSVGPQVKALLSEGKYKQADDLMAADTDFQLAVKVQPRLFTHIEGRGGLERSEFYPSPLAEKIPVIKHPIRASGRAFEIGQNLGILNSFKDMLARAKKRGINIDPDTAEGLKELKGMLEVAGAQVGRGLFKTKTFQGAQPLLSQGLFAPSFYKSRLTWFSPRWYWKLPKVARYEALRTMGQFLGGSAAILYGADKLTGATVSVDPRSSDFGKIRIGDTRLDTLGGFQQWARLVAQIASGKYVDTKTGEVIEMKPGIGNRTRWDTFVSFATGKASPPASLIIDWAKGTDYQYRPFEWKRSLYTRMLPLVLQDMWKVYGETGSIPAAGAAYVAAGAGVGVQSYTDPKPAKAKAAFKAWKQTAETAWRKAHPESPQLPLVIVRAERDRAAVEALMEKYPKGSDERERNQARALLAYMVQTHPDLKQYMSYYQPVLQRGSKDELKSLVRNLRYSLYGKTLSSFNTIMPDEEE